MTTSTVGGLVITEQNLPAILAFMNECKLDTYGLPLEPGCEINKFATEGIELVHNGKPQYRAPFFENYQQRADFFNRFNRFTP